MPAHSFHIPVMGTGFTIDTPLKVARYGISSVVSLGDDRLLEKIRRYYSDLYQEEYRPIPEAEKDHRALRITAYLDFLDRTVRDQVRRMKEMPFSGSNDLCRYFELLEDQTPLKREYVRMLSETGPGRSEMQSRLKEKVAAGAIDVNIMTKADRENDFHGQRLPREYSDAMAALRGFARSGLESSVVFSAGLNLHLYSYIAEFDDFHADRLGNFKKKITLKVSDFRSAGIQAKILAKKGLWVSEYRIESGLNCGGHAFPTTGSLLGPILEEFKRKRNELADSLFPLYRDALVEKGRVAPDVPPRVRVTAQGGVGTSAEHELLLRYYEVDSVGWGSPFLLVPEATTVDGGTLGQLAAAGEDDIYLSHASPLGVPFYNLRSSASEQARRERVAAGKPGSPCLSKYLAFNTEFGRPLCLASASYQRRKLEQIQEKALGASDAETEKRKVLEKSCICRDLGDGALLKYGILDEKKEMTPAVCPGPNLAYFSKILSLKEMIGHIYGRLDHVSAGRSHFFINELRLYVRYLKEIVSESRAGRKEAEYFAEFKSNLSQGIAYYKDLSERIVGESKASRQKFLDELAALAADLEELVLFPKPATL